MSSIIAKPFDVAKKIVRAVFLGAPNLTTTSDLNRQIEALKFQLDLLDDRLGQYKAGNLTLTASSGTDEGGPFVSIAIGQSGGVAPWVIMKGARFEIPMGTTKIYTQGATEKTYYVVIAAPITTVTYANDPTHEISGAKFADDRSAAAANHLVYGTPTLSVVAQPASVNNRVGILAQIHRNTTAAGSVAVVVKKNYWTVDSDTFRDPIIWNSVPKDYTGNAPIEGTKMSDMAAFFSRVIVPIKSIIPYYGSVRCNDLPYGWVPCGKYSMNTSADRITEQANLTTRYGSDVTYVNTGAGGEMRITQCLGVTIPDLSNRFLVQAGDDYSLGSTGGEKEHTLTLEEMPKHNHSISVAPNQYIIDHASRGHQQIGEVDGSTGYTGGRSTDAAGGCAPHENRPPYHAVYYIMRVC